jgi:hypothetical protein
MNPDPAPDPDADPDADPYPAIYVSDLQDVNIFFLVFLRFFAYYFLNVHLHHSHQDPYLWLMDPDPGGPKTYGFYGSGSATLSITVVQHVLYTVPVHIYRNVNGALG